MSNGKMIRRSTRPAGARQRDGLAVLPLDARLRFSSDVQAGYARRRAKSSFRYVDPAGGAIVDEETIARVRALAIPPAWTDVWICADPRGHLQAVGRDARGRKQYRYHPAWRVRRDRSKFGRMVEFGRALPRIRRVARRDLARPGLSREKILATVVVLLDTTAMRIGNAAYARANGSFGLTTLRNRHLTVFGTTFRFRFRGKGGTVHDIGVRDRRLARIVARCSSLPGQELFQYLDEDGEPRAIESADVNAYLQEAGGSELTAKDFRTWTGTLIAFHELRSRPAATAPGERPAAAIGLSAAAVAETLGNTPAISRKSYIAPEVIDSYRAGLLPPGRRRRTGSSEPGGRAADRSLGRREELALLRLLERSSVRSPTSRGR